MSNLASILLLTMSLFACTGSGGGGPGGDDDPTPDAPAVTPDGGPGAPDAPVGAAASVVPCGGATIAGDIWYYDGIGYVGSALNAELPVGSIVQFHDMSSHTADHAQGLFSMSGDEPSCVKFNGVGSYEFRCYFHNEEAGAINIVSVVGP
ncbi:MAG: hypothetical protein ACKV2T_38135 [Kofleriaceae bacterium]